MTLINPQPDLPPEPSFGTQLNHFWQRWVGPRELMPFVEREMLKLSYTLRSKPSWWTKYQTPDIRAKWRAEALGQARYMKVSHIDYVLDELDGFAQLRDNDSGVEVSCYDGIWQSDRLVSDELKARLISSVAVLENVPDEQKDWHPRSNGQVLDLVHPSLYPVVYDRTLEYPEGTIGHDPSKLQAVIIPLLHSDKRGDDPNYGASYTFQWLPTEFRVSEDGKSVKSLGYINNLHPNKHHDLHEAIEGLIGGFLPLFERVLTDLIPANKCAPERTTNMYFYDPSNCPPEPDERDYDDEGALSAAFRVWSELRPVESPALKYEKYVHGSLERRKRSYPLAGETIQVVVKLANIHLTPENPTYPGGSWHVEGMRNEAIAASGIYYYSEENITQSRLAFRDVASPPENYEQGDERGCKETWGISEEDPCINELGDVITCEDRAIAFPNVYQHKVSPFELVDKARPGHRKIVALFLVDPHISRPSTTRVPPQQQDWVKSAMFENQQLKKLPLEIISNISTLVDGTMTRDEANAYRLELMDERSYFVGDQNSEYSQVTFNLCEH